MFCTVQTVAHGYAYGKKMLEFCYTKNPQGREHLNDYAMNTQK